MSLGTRRDKIVSRHSAAKQLAYPPRPVRITAAAALAFTPLALVTGVFVSHDVIPKVILLTTSAAVLLLLLPQWLKPLCVLWNQSRGRRFLILVASQFVSLLLSTLFSYQVPLSFAGTVWRRFGLVEQTGVLVIATAIACLAASRPAWIHELFKAVAICGALAAAYGILQYFDLDPFLERRLYAIDYFGGIARPPGTMGHALYFSAYLVPLLFIATCLVFHETKNLWRRIYAAIALLAGVAIVLSGTRSAMLAALVAGVLFAWRAARGRTWSLTRKYVVVLAVALLAISFFVFSPAGQNLRGRILQWRSGGGPRLQMWIECPALIGQHLVLGEGPELFAGEFRKLQSAKLSREYPDFYNETPHNALIDAACAQGIPGLLILAGVFAIVWSAGRNNAFAANAIMHGIEAGMLGILISSMFASLTLVTSLYLWTLAGIAVAIAPGTQRTEHPREVRFLRIPGMALSVVLLAGGIVLAFQDSSWADLGSAVESKNFARALDAYSRATLFGHGLPGYELWGSREWALLGRSLGNSPEGATAWRTAAAAASLAEIGGEERFSAAYQSSVLAFAAGDLARAETEAREVIRLAPNWYKGHLLLSQILQILRKNSAASNEARWSEALGGKK